MRFFTPRVFNDRVVHPINDSYYCSVAFLSRLF